MEVTRRGVFRILPLLLKASSLYIPLLVVVLYQAYRHTGILAGYTSDRIEARGITSVIFLFSSIVGLLLYCIYGSISIFANTALMFLSGSLVNGPYSLITTAVAADLGTNSAVGGNARDPLRPWSFKNWQLQAKERQA
ncbi:hypothetical protein Droror1_Dr00020811 [Drosera rotundifolia]